MNKKGFSIIEYIIYLGISAIVLTALVTFTWGIINDQINQKTQSATDDTAGFIIDKVVTDIQQASSLHEDTLFLTDPGILALNMPDGSIVTYQIFQQTIIVNGQSKDISSMKKTILPGDECIVSADSVEIDDFILEDISNESITTIKITLNIKSINDTSQAYAAEQQIITSATIRAQ